MSVDTKSINRGLDALLRDYRAIRPDVNKNAAEIVLAVAKKTAPVSRSRSSKSGRVSASQIVSRPGRLKRSLRVEMSPAGAAVVKAGTDAYYIAYVTGGTKHVTANPFMDRAYKTTGKQVSSYMYNRLKEVLR